MTAAATERRRQILDAAVRVFARRGFHTCRVSDIADEAGVAYGLVYHYFSSKEQMLDTVFLDRWDVMLAAIAEADASELATEDKLRAIASLIIDSYRHDPDVMKVIVVAAQASGEFRAESTPECAAQAFYGAGEQVLTGWIFDERPVGAPEFERAKTMIVELITGGLRPPRPDVARRV